MPKCSHWPEFQPCRSPSTAGASVCISWAGHQGGPTDASIAAAVETTAHGSPLCQEGRFRPCECVPVLAAVKQRGA